VRRCISLLGCSWAVHLAGNRRWEARGFVDGGGFGCGDGFGCWRLRRSRSLTWAEGGW
jgi:hypothetical protein